MKASLIEEYKMHFVAKLMILGILISGLTEIEGIQCYSNNKGQSEDTLKTCPDLVKVDAVPACFISISKIAKQLMK